MNGFTRMKPNSEGRCLITTQARAIRPNSSPWPECFFEKLGSLRKKYPVLYEELKEWLLPGSRSNFSMASKVILNLNSNAKPGPKPD